MLIFAAEIMRKAANANKSFLTGTALLGIAVIAIVFIFLIQAVHLSANKEEQMKQDIYRFVLSDDLAGKEISLWMNDSLIAVHAHAGDTVTHCRLAAETSLLLVDEATDKVAAVQNVSAKSGLILLHGQPSAEE